MKPNVLWPGVLYQFFVYETREPLQVQFLTRLHTFNLVLAHIDRDGWVDHY